MAPALTLLASLCASRAAAVEIEDVGGETLTIDISNTTEVGYHFDNRNVTTTAGTLLPNQHVDDDYFEWLNRLYVRSYYWKVSFGLRLDSAVYAATLDRQAVQELIVDELGAPDLDLENQFARELHTRYTNLVYPAKLWLGFKHDWFEVTAGDFYQQLGRGMVFSVRKLDEVGIDTTVRGGKLSMAEEWDSFGLEATLFGGQLNPIRIDFPTGRILHGSGSPLFFAFPQVDDFEYYRSVGPSRFELARERAKPSYLEDNVVGGNLTLGPKEVKVELNSAVLLRQSNSQEQQRCLDTVPTGSPRAAEDATDLCLSEFPAFSTPEATRSHDQIRNFGGAIRVPAIEGIVDIYAEAAGQQQTDGRVLDIAPDGSTLRETDLWGYGIYANVNARGGIFAATLEGKHYRSFFPLGANIDFSTRGFDAPEYNVVTYSQAPTTESIYVETIGARDVCVSGGRGRLDAKIAPNLNIYGWLGRYVSYSEINPNNNTCETAEELETHTWDAASGAEIDVPGGQSHYWAWIGARVTDRAELAQPNPNIPGLTTVFYREGYVRYDFNQHLAGPVSLSALGNHRKRYEPDQLAEAWHEGENLLAVNWNPHMSFIFGYEYQTRPGLPTHYFNGAVQFRSKNDDTWWGQVFDSVRAFVGQRRAALRCVGGVCRVFPAFEGAKLELVSRF
jgi:hypothetical protein